MPASFDLFSGFNKLSTFPAGSFAKASLVGANTVKGPYLFKVVTRSAAFIAATSEVCAWEPAATSTMSFLACAVALMVSTAATTKSTAFLNNFIIVYLNVKKYSVKNKTSHKQGFIITIG